MFYPECKEKQEKGDVGFGWSVVAVA